MKSSCSIAGCSSPHLAKGLCGLHYQRRRRYGDPNESRHAANGSRLRFLQANVGYDGDGCLFFPGVKRTRQSVEFEGAEWKASRLMCRLAHGTPPSDRHEAAHSCGKGDLGCIHPLHLRWATKIENESDKVRHGTLLNGEAHPKAKLSMAQIRCVRLRIERGETQASVARAFGISETQISRIKNKKHWRHVD